MTDDDTIGCSSDEYCETAVNKYARHGTGISYNFRGDLPPTPPPGPRLIKEGDGREGKGRNGVMGRKVREGGKGREGVGRFNTPIL